METVALQVEVMKEEEEGRGATEGTAIALDRLAAVAKQEGVLKEEFWD